MSVKSEIEAKIAEAEQELRELKEQRERERERLQHAEIERLEDHLSHARVRLSDLKPAADAAWGDLRKLLETLIADLRRLRGDFKKRD